MFPDRDETDYVELRGGAKVTGGPNSNALRSMSARDINLDYAEDGRSLQNATLAGAAAIQLAAKAGGDGQRLAGEYMEIGLEPDGSVRSLNTRDAVTVTLPATKDTAGRTIRSNSLVAAGSAQGLREMKFSEGVEYREAATKTQGARIAKARSLEAQLDPRPAHSAREVPGNLISRTARCGPSAARPATTSSPAPSPCRAKRSHRRSATIR